MGRQIHSAGSNNWKFDKRGVIVIYVAGQNLISSAHVDPELRQNCEPRPPRLDFFPFAISPRGLLTVRCHREPAESRKKARLLTLMDLSNTVDDGGAHVK